MNAFDLFVSLRRRWRVIAILAAATVAIAWITTPPQSKGSAGSTTWQAHPTIYADGGKQAGLTLERMSSYLTSGRVPAIVAKQMKTTSVQGSADTAKGAKRHV